MKRLLIISPNFPPVNAADMHRIRLSLPFYKEYGWEPVVLTINPEFSDGTRDELLLKTVPNDTEIHQVKAMSSRITKHIGINNVGIRSIPYLYKKGLKLITENNISLVFFSTTCFHLLFLGRLWKNRTDVPYVIDMQDPWYNESGYENDFKNVSKFRANREIHKRLESWTMKRAGGLISVSEAYIEMLKNRYKTLNYVPSKTLGFGASKIDFEILEANPRENRFFDKKDEYTNGVYIGRAGSDMKTALNIIFSALKKGIKSNANIFQKVKIYFIGTDYSPLELSTRTVEPAAKRSGVEDHVFEFPGRIPYFETLQILKDSDFIIVPGSDELEYSASKIYPYILSEKPMITVFRDKSPVAGIMSELNAGINVPFNPGEKNEPAINELYSEWGELLDSLPFKPGTDWKAFEKYTARSLTSEQCSLFDEVVSNKF